MDIVFYILVAICSLLVSILLKGLIDKFVAEDKSLENFYNYYEENKDLYSKQEIKKIYKIRKENNKVKLKPTFSIAVFVTTLIAFMLLFIFKTDYISFFINAFLISLLIVCAFADIKACIIPDEINVVGLIAGIAYIFYNSILDCKVGLDLLLGGATGFLIFLAIGTFAYLIFKKEGMGGGDIKMMGMIGLFMGFKNIIQIFILSFFIAAIISIFLLITKIKNKDDYIPFGPFIVLATFFTMFFSATVMQEILFKMLVAVV